jgi:hypothetical protein
MGVPTSEVGYTSATTGRRDHEVHKGHVVALDKNKKIIIDKPLTYATFTWTLTNRERKQINVFERKLNRRILGPVYDNEK